MKLIFVTQEGTIMKPGTLNDSGDCRAGGRAGASVMDSLYCGVLVEGSHAL
jgi:hypothetical protein